MGTNANGGSLTKEQRFNQMNDMRKIKREELIMKRRGLNFINDNAAENLNEEEISVVENEVDNIAPKVVGILALNTACDITTLRTEMVKHCIEY